MKLAFLISVVLFSGCATVKHLTPTGGSRSDGIVRMSYEYGLFEKPVVNWQAGGKLAQRRCSAWNYTGAEAFGGSTRRCVYRGSDGCVRWMVTMEYQCIGRTQ